MGGTLALSLITGLFSGEATRLVRRARRKSIFWAAIALFVLTAWAMAIVAAVIGLSRGSDPLTATLTVAGLLLATATLLYVIMAITDRMERHRERQEATRNSVYISAAMLALPVIFRSRALLLLALLAGGGALAASQLRKDPSDDAPGDPEL